MILLELVLDSTLLPQFFLGVFSLSINPESYFDSMSVISMLSFPNKKRFAFTIFDDTDHSTLKNVKPVYDLLTDLGFKTTKSIWIYPPRGNFTGSCLQDPDYLSWILELQSHGFEIGLHNVGDGAFNRNEILAGLEIYNSLLGHYPTCHTNHANNPDNIYWLKDRFDWPFNDLYGLFRLINAKSLFSKGSDPSSEYFWGDIAKQHLRYTRNFTFNGINTLHFDPRMPYRIRKKDTYSNLWFSSSDGRNLTEMNQLLNPDNVDALEQEGGVSIVYTHFASGFVDAEGRLDTIFKRQMEYLAAKEGWFVPVTELLDHIAIDRPTDDPGYLYRFGLNWHWLKNHLQRRSKKSDKSAAIESDFL